MSDAEGALSPIANVAPVIDLHTHILHGVPGGTRSLAEAVAAATDAARSGTTRLVATPRVSADGPSPSQIASRVAELRAALGEAGTRLVVESGALLPVDLAMELDDATLRGHGLGDAGAWLLIELPAEGWPLRLPEFVAGLEVRGFRALVAHPERARAVQLNPDRLRDLVGRGVMSQLDAASLAGAHGALIRQVAGTLLRNGMAHVIATETRGPGGTSLVEGLEAAAGVMRAEAAEMGWTVMEGPRQVLAGGPVRAPRLGVGPAPRVEPRDRDGDRPPRPPRGEGGERPGRPGGPRGPRRDGSGAGGQESREGGPRPGQRPGGPRGGRRGAPGQDGEGGRPPRPGGGGKGRPGPKGPGGAGGGQGGRGSGPPRPRRPRGDSPG